MLRSDRNVTEYLNLQHVLVWQSKYEHILLWYKKAINT